MTCIFCDMRKRYNLTGKCQIHQLNKDEKCERCAKEALYGNKNQRATRCKLHKIMKMGLTPRICEYCPRRARYGYPDDCKLLRCDIHIGNDGMRLIN